MTAIAPISCNRCPPAACPIATLGPKGLLTPRGAAQARSACATFVHENEKRTRARKVKPLHLGDHVGADPIAQRGLATYAAGRAEALVSSSFSRARFIHCSALQRRNLRSASLLVRAAYHSHWRACSKHSVTVGDMTRPPAFRWTWGACINAAWRAA